MGSCRSSKQGGTAMMRNLEAVRLPEIVAESRRRSAHAENLTPIGIITGLLAEAPRWSSAFSQARGW